MEHRQYPPSRHIPDFGLAKNAFHTSPSRVARRVRPAHKRSLSSSLPFFASFSMIGSSSSRQISASPASPRVSFRTNLGDVLWPTHVGVRSTTVVRAMMIVIIISIVAPIRVSSKPLRMMIIDPIRIVAMPPIRIMPSVPPVPTADLPSFPSVCPDIGVILKPFRHTRVLG